MPPPRFASCVADPRAAAGRLAAIVRLNLAASSSTAVGSASPRSRRRAWTYAARSPSTGGLGRGVATAGGGGGAGVGTITGVSGGVILTTGGGCVRGIARGGLAGGGGVACVGGGDCGGGVGSAASWTCSRSAICSSSSPGLKRRVRGTHRKRMAMWISIDNAIISQTRGTATTSCPGRSSSIQWVIGELFSGGNESGGSGCRGPGVDTKFHQRRMPVSPRPSRRSARTVRPIRR